MSHGKQFTLYTQVSGPNGWKVVFVLEELGLTYESIYLDFAKAEQKGPEYTKFTPNGRIPTLIDHQNGDFTIWESDAILLYLTDKYDAEKKLTVTGDEKYSLIQWLFFQASGQGPYFGQALWFIRFHPERIPSAIERYQKETLRVFSVLDSVLSKPENGGWLVDGLCGRRKRVPRVLCVAPEAPCSRRGKEDIRNPSVAPEVDSGYPVSSSAAHGPPGHECAMGWNIPLCIINRTKRMSISHA